MSKCLISIIIPCYHSKDTLPDVVNEIKKTFAVKQDEYDYQIILVNDNPSDDTFKTIEMLCQEDKKIVGLGFTRNFGQHSALMAGLRCAQGNYVILIDDDGQTPADEMFSLIEKLEQGADAVIASYSHKKHNLFRRFVSWLNEKILCHMINKPKHLYISSYIGFSSTITKEVIKYTNPYPNIVGLILRSTSNIVNVSVNHRKRNHGKSGYSLTSLFSMWINGFTAFSVKPLRIASFIGVLVACIGFITAIYAIIARLVNPDMLMGYTSIMAALLLLCGIIMLMLGMIGEYIGRIYISLNNAPQYVVLNSINTENTTIKK